MSKGRATGKRATHTVSPSGGGVTVSHVVAVALALAGGTGRPANISHMFDRMPAGTSLAHFHSRLIEAHSRGLIVLSKNDNAYALTARDRERAVMVGDSPRHIVYVLP